MENMNQYYNFILNDEGYEVRLKSNDELMAFYSEVEQGGFIAKNYVDYAKYKSFNRWIKGLKIHRDINIKEDDFIKKCD